VLKDWIDESYAELYDMMVEANPENFLASASLAITSGTESYDLEAVGRTGLYKVVGFDMVDGNYSYPMDRFNWSERRRLQGGGSSRRSTRYCIIGEKVYFAPKPTFSGSVTVWYVPTPLTPAYTGTAIDGRAGWEEFIVADVCAKAKMADDEDQSPFVTQREAARNRIEHSAHQRDKANPDHVRDVDAEGLYSQWPWYYSA
jgi:hypothetical protein